VTGMASTEGNVDDDGNSYGLELINTDQLTVLNDLIKEVKADKSGFLKYLKVSSLEILPISKYDQAVKALEAKK
nr:hypothetical protein [Bacteroidales bacterium]